MKCHVIHFVKKRVQDAKAMWITPPSTDIFSLTLLYTSCTVPSFLRTNLPDDPSGKITCTMTPSASASSLPAKHKNRKWWNNHMMIRIVLIRIPMPLRQYNKNFERFERNRLCFLKCCDDERHPTEKSIMLELLPLALTVTATVSCNWRPSPENNLHNTHIWHVTVKTQNTVYLLTDSQILDN